MLPSFPPLISVKPRVDLGNTDFQLTLLLLTGIRNLRSTMNISKLEML